MLDSYAFLFVPLGVDLDSKILFFLISSGYISIDFILTRLKESHVSYTGGGFPSYFPPPKI